MKIATSAAMHELGKQVAAELNAGDLIILDGALGAGRLSLRKVSERAWELAKLHRPPSLFRAAITPIHRSFMSMPIVC
jgi:tRNA A37 threonylcarbamoyladenosine biosynthesis protein TsaE